MKKAPYDTSLNVDLAKYRELFVRASVILSVRYLAHKPAGFLISKTAAVSNETTAIFVLVRFSCVYANAQKGCLIFQWHTMRQQHQ